MSDLFLAWRKAQDPLHIGGPLDELLELAFDAGRGAEATRIAEAIGLGMESLENREEKIERTIWVSRDLDCFGDQPEYWEGDRPAYIPDATTIIYSGTAATRNLNLNDVDEVPARVQDLGSTLSPGELKRCVLIDCTWYLREPDGA